MPLEVRVWNVELKGLNAFEQLACGLPTAECIPETGIRFRRVFALALLEAAKGEEKAMAARLRWAARRTEQGLNVSKKVCRCISGQRWVRLREIFFRMIQDVHKKSTGVL